MAIDILSTAIKVDSLRDLSGIYRITSPAGRIYIGQAQCIHKRWAHHKSTGKVRHSNRVLGASFAKYGIENHSFEVVEIVSLDRLDEREQAWLDAAKSAGFRVMNLSPTASSIRGYKFTEEQKRRCSVAQKIAKSDPLKRAEQSARSKLINSDKEFVRKRIEKRKEQLQDPAERLAISKRTKASWERLGVEERADRVRRVSEAMQRPESKAKRSETTRKAFEDPTKKAALANGVKRAWADPEKRANLRAGMIERNARPEMQAQYCLNKCAYSVKMNNRSFSNLREALRSIDAFNAALPISVEECRRVRELLKSNYRAKFSFCGSEFEVFREITA